MILNRIDFNGGDLRLYTVAEELPLWKRLVGIKPKTRSYTLRLRPLFEAEDFPLGAPERIPGLTPLLVKHVAGVEPLSREERFANAKKRGIAYDPIEARKRLYEYIFPKENA